MTTPRQIVSNRVNSLRSTGPRTPAGLTRSSLNGLKAGLFSRLLVLPGLGETAVEYEHFRGAVVADLEPVGAVEGELADRVAGLMWRLRRVTRYEAAAMAAALGELPPHPDDVGPLPGDGVCFPVPEGAPTAFRLAHLRARVSGASAAIAAHRTAVAALDAGADDRSPVDPAAARKALDAAAAELGWFTIPCPWPKVLSAVERLVAAVQRHRSARVTAADVLRWLVALHDPQTASTPITREDVLAFPAVTTAAHRAA